MGPALGLMVGVGLSACRPSASEAPRVDVRSMSLDDIEAELDRNYELLADAGIAVASVEAQGLAAKAEPEPQPQPQPQPEPEDDDGGSEAIEHQEQDSAELDHAEPSETAPAAAAPDDHVRESFSVEREDGGRRSRRSRQRRSTSLQEQRQPSRCERVCDLADATCDLEAQICDLASRHPEQERYQLACTRAEAQCEAAMEACERCDEE